jgi:hypothetical protein
MFARLAHQSGLDVPRAARVRDFVDEAFRVLQWRDNRHEYVYRAALLQKLLLGKHSLATATMMTQFRVADRKADVVILNGTSTVYEIKSERDTLTRLEQQVAAYLKVFDFIHVISGAEHLREIDSIVPSSIGILLLSDRFQISVVRPAKSNRSNVVPSVVFDSLQRREAVAILERLGRLRPRLPNTLIHSALQKEFATLPPSAVHDAMVDVLKRTRSTVDLEHFVLSMPGSMRAAALSISMTKAQRSRLAAAMDEPIDQAVRWS